MVKAEIIIIGGGIAGLLTAKILGKQKFDVVLVEKNEFPKTFTPKPSGRTSALMQTSLEMLKETGLWEEIKQFCNPLKTMRIIDGTKHVSFHAEDINLPYFGQNVPNQILHGTLLQSIKKLKNVKVLDKKELWDFQADEKGITAFLSDDTEIHAQLLIGADGRHSVVRHIAGIPAIKTKYGQTAITCLIEHTASHDNISNEFHKPGGPFTTVPGPGNTSAIVWCEKDEDADIYMSMNKDDFTQALQDRTENLLGTVSLKTSPESWKLKGQVARKLTTHRVALIAEAAHALHPIGAQGLNLSIRDIKALTDLLIQQRSIGLDIGSLKLLKEYKAKRRRDVLTRFAGVTGLNGLTSKKSKGIQRIRQAGLSLIDRSALIKRQAMRWGLAS